MQPRTGYKPAKHSNSLSKVNQREECLTCYTRVTGRNKLPKGHAYMLLASDQSYSGSDLHTKLRQGFLKEEQIIGVDWSKAICDTNSTAFPRGIFPAESWNDWLLKAGSMKPGLIFLDAVSVIGHDVLREMVIRTMYRCAPDTVLIVNAQRSNSYRPSTRKKVMEDSLHELVRGISPYELEKWDQQSCGFDYQNGPSLMRTHVLYKRR